MKTENRSTDDERIKDQKEKLELIALIGLAYLGAILAPIIALASLNF